jgi:hypothetical protein
MFDYYGSTPMRCSTLTATRTLGLLRRSGSHATRGLLRFDPTPSSGLRRGVTTRTPGLPRRAGSGATREGGPAARPPTATPP